MRSCVCVQCLITVCLGTLGPTESLQEAAICWLVWIKPDRSIQYLFEKLHVNGVENYTVFCLFLGTRVYYYHLSKRDAQTFEIRFADIWGTNYICECAKIQKVQRPFTQGHMQMSCKKSACKKTKFRLLFTYSIWHRCPFVSNSLWLLSCLNNKTLGGISFWTFLKSCKMFKKLLISLSSDISDCFFSSISVFVRDKKHNYAALFCTPECHHNVSESWKTC